MDIVVKQDGRTFTFTVPVTGEEQVHTAPDSIWNTRGTKPEMKAQVARRWFIEFVCYDSGFSPKFED
ncbi:hypothetical protein EVB27_068 [Rhizobium phage RHph_TM16]|nr:hypothetical protein EVB27_068 [Rhizobium phage RHph_TM16]